MKRSSTVQVFYLLLFTCPILFGRSDTLSTVVCMETYTLPKEDIVNGMNVTSDISTAMKHYKKLPNTTNNIKIRATLLALQARKWDKVPISELPNIKNMINSIKAYDDHQCSFVLERLSLICELEMQKEVYEKKFKLQQDNFQKKMTESYQDGFEQGKSTPTVIAWITGTLLLLFLAILFFSNHKKIEIYSNDELESEIEEAKKEILNLNKERDELNRRNAEILKQYTDLKIQSEKADNRDSVKTVTKDNYINNEKEYIKILMAEFFMRPPQENGFFDMQQPLSLYIPNVAMYKFSRIKAEFEFVNRRETFKQDISEEKNISFACEIPRNAIPSSAQEIETLSRGEVEFLPDGRWKIIDKAKIKFI